MTGADILRTLGSQLLASAALPVPPPEPHAPAAEPVATQCPAWAANQIAGWARFAGWLEGVLLSDATARGDERLVAEIERRRRELTR